MWKYRVHLAFSSEQLPWFWAQRINIEVPRHICEIPVWPQTCNYLSISISHKNILFDSSVDIHLCKCMLNGPRT